MLRRSGREICPPPLSSLTASVLGRPDASVVACFPRSVSTATGVAIFRAPRTARSRSTPRRRVGNPLPVAEGLDPVRRSDIAKIWNARSWRNAGGGGACPPTDADKNLADRLDAIRHTAVRLQQDWVTWVALMRLAYLSRPKQICTHRWQMAL